MWTLINSSVPAEEKEVQVVLGEIWLICMLYLTVNFFFFFLHKGLQGISLGRPRPFRTATDLHERLQPMARFHAFGALPNETGPHPIQGPSIYTEEEIQRHRETLKATLKQQFTGAHQKHEWFWTSVFIYTDYSFLFLSFVCKYSFLENPIQFMRAKWLFLWKTENSVKLSNINWFPTTLKPSVLCSEMGTHGVRQWF